jgi:hypothetical protein
MAKCSAIPSPYGVGCRVPTIAILGCAMHAKNQRRIVRPISPCASSMEWPVLICAEDA